MNTTDKNTLTQKLYNMFNARSHKDLLDDSRSLIESVNKIVEECKAIEDAKVKVGDIYRIKAVGCNRGTYKLVVTSILGASLGKPDSYQLTILEFDTNPTVVGTAWTWPSKDINDIFGNTRVEYFKKVTP
tara:strand:- start:366 stop:755 length:390 start_codon:yes stop_codon:yes gene_type:complete